MNEFLSQNTKSSPTSHQSFTTKMRSQKRKISEGIDLTQDELAISIEHDYEPFGIDRTSYGCRKWRRTTVQTHLQTSTRPRNTSDLNAESTLSSPAGQPDDFSKSGIVVNNDTSFRNLSTTALIKPIDRTAALHRSAYDPETVARDVLLAAGLHPHRKGLNCHLEVLRTKFPQVDHSSDLATFRWDLVEPVGGPAINMPPGFGIDGNRTEEKLPVRGPLKPSRGGISSLSNSLPRNPTDTTPYLPSSLRNTSTLGPESTFQVVMKPPDRQQSLGQEPMQFPILNKHETSQAPGSDLSGSRPSGTARRGRPPKGLTSTRLESPGVTPKKRGRPFKIPRTSPSTEPIRKKRGRPFKNSDSAGVSTSPDRHPKKRGRPFKIPRPERPPPEPRFIPFLCEWKDCPAELHNLETLRTHIFNVHSKKLSSGALTCLWRKCGEINGAIDMSSSPNIVEKPFEFETMEQWQNHINKAHLVPFSWHMGDGPRGTSLGIYSHIPYFLVMQR